MNTPRQDPTRRQTVAAPIFDAAEDLPASLTSGHVESLASPNDDGDPAGPSNDDDDDAQSGAQHWLPGPSYPPKKRSSKFGVKTSHTPPQGNDPWDYTQKYAEDIPYTEMGSTARLWKVYNDEAAKFDTDMIDDWKDGLDMLLVFAALFSAVLTTFVVETSQTLSQNFQEVTASLLVELIAIQRATGRGVDIDNIPASTLTPSSAFRPRPIDVAVNACWFISLSLSLATALIAVVAKQWIHQYTMIPSGSPRDRARVRHFRFLGLEKWHLPAIIGLLPTLMHVSLGVFFVGLAVFLHDLSTVIAGVVDAILVVTLFAYLGSNALSLIAVDCPYKTPLAMYLFSALESLLSKFHRNTTTGQAVPTSLRDAERNTVAARADETDVHATVWLLAMSSNSSVKTVVLEALSNVPLKLLPSFRAVAPPNLGDLITENAALSWQGPDTAQAERNLRAHLRFSPNPSFLPLSHLARLAKNEFSEVGAIDSPTKYLFIDLHYPAWVRVSRFSSVRCTLPIIKTALMHDFNAPRYDPLLWIMFFNLAARWGTLREKELFQKFLEIGVQHPPVAKGVQLAELDTRIMSWASKAETYRKQKYTFTSLGLDYSAVRKPFSGSQRTREEIDNSHTRPHTLVHTIRHLVFSSFCEFLLGQLSIRTDDHAPVAVVTDEELRMHQKVSTHLRLLLYIAESDVHRRTQPELVGFAISKIDEYAVSKEHAAEGDGIDWSTEARLILLTVARLIKSAAFMEDRAMSKSATKKTLSVHGKLLVLLVRLAEHSRDEFSAWLQEDSVPILIRITLSSLVKTNIGDYCTLQHTQRSRTGGSSYTSPIVFSAMPLVSLFEAALHSRPDLLIPLYNHFVDSHFIRAKVRVPDCLGPIMIRFVDGLDMLSAHCELYTKATHFVCHPQNLFSVCRSLLLMKEYRSLRLLARHSFRADAELPVARWTRTLKGLAMHVAGYQDWDDEKKSVFAMKVEELVAFVEGRCVDRISGDEDYIGGGVLIEDASFVKPRRLWPTRIIPGRSRDRPYDVEKGSSESSKSAF